MENQVSYSKAEKTKVTKPAVSENSSAIKYKPREPKGKKTTNTGTPKDRTQTCQTDSEGNSNFSENKKKKLIRRCEIYEKQNTGSSEENTNSDHHRRKYFEQGFPLLPRIKGKKERHKNIELPRLKKGPELLTSIYSQKCKLSKLDTKSEKEEDNNIHNKYLAYSILHNMELEVNRTSKDSKLLKDEKYSNYNELTQKVHDQVNTLIESLHEIFQLYKPSEVMLSFNGGKDCTVVLHLLHTYFQSNPCLQHIKIPTLYITDPDAFEEVEEFVIDCEKLFNIDLIRKPGPIKNALEELCKEKPRIKAVFMGCRRTDPYCQDLKIMQPTDAGWPPLMRINPILDWKCRDVWQYMYLYNVPYCSLYQKGYTSIGNKTNTQPNPYLRVVDDTTGAVLNYRPGHELIDNDELERAGRIKPNKDNSTSK